ncbi:MAG: Spy/CpxP family protein refolding chaperone [Methylocystis sp.]
MPKLKLRTNAGVVAAMLLGAFLSAVPSQGGHVRQGAQAKEASASRDDRLAEASEFRIKELRGRLQVTAAQESLWNNVAQIMRDNAATFRANVPDRSTGPDTSTAVDDLKAFQIIADEHANGLRKLIPAFEALYASMTPAQKKHADQVFRKHERQGDF